METLITDFSYNLLIWNTVLLVSIVLWMYAITNLLKSSFEKDDKLIWLLVIIFIPIIGSLFYVFIGKKEI
jgi:hypothetical protein